MTLNPGKIVLDKYGREYFVRMATKAASNSREMSRRAKLRGRLYRPCQSKRNRRRSKAHQFRKDICAYCKRSRDELRKT
jgi:hypothetical protein